MKKIATLAFLAVLTTGAANAAEGYQDLAFYTKGAVEAPCNAAAYNTGCNTCATAPCGPCARRTETVVSGCCVPTCVKTCDAPCGKMVCCPEVRGIFGTSLFGSWI